jgi:hypothetical protein
LLEEPQIRMDSSQMNLKYSFQNPPSFHNQMCLTLELVPENIVSNLTPYGRWYIGSLY